MQDYRDCTLCGITFKAKFQKNEEIVDIKDISGKGELFENPITGSDLFALAHLASKAHSLFIPVRDWDGDIMEYIVKQNPTPEDILANQVWMYYSNEVGKQFDLMTEETNQD